MSRKVTEGPTSEDWDLLVSFFPDNWRDLAVQTGALRGLRKDKLPEKLLRTLLIHLGCGLSLRETVGRKESSFCSRHRLWIPRINRWDHRHLGGYCGDERGVPHRHRVSFRPWRS